MHLFSLSECFSRVDFVIMLDSSGSINREDFERVLNFIRQLSSRLDVDSGLARIALVTFSTQSTVIFDLDDFTRNTDISRAIQVIINNYM